MNIDYCREFLELAQCLNFTEAASKLNITQPALSKHLLSLEKEFSVALLDRSRKGVRLTEAGRIFFESCGIIMNTYDDAKEKLSSIKDKKPIRVAGHLEDSDVSALVSMSSMIAREKHHLTMVFDRNTEGDPYDLLENGEIDLFLGYANPEQAERRGLICEPFVVSPLVAIVGTYHSFADRALINWNELSNETLVKFMSGKTSPAWEQIDTICQKHGFSPKTRPVSSLNDVEFFSTPLRGSVLIWKKTQKQIGLLLETGHRACASIVDEDAVLVAYAIYNPEQQMHLDEFFSAIHEAKALLDRRRDRKDLAD